jgi:histidinol-phosphate aminotransferase
MPVSRRNLLRQLGAGAMVSAALPSLVEVSLPAAELPPVEKRPTGPIILGRNENAYGPSEKVLATMRTAVPAANRYPVRQGNNLLDRVANMHGIKPDRIVLGCGSSELLMAAVLSYTGPGKKLITALPTFELAGHTAPLTGADVVTVPLAKNFAHDLNGMLARADSSTGLIYICNPNNPTASLTMRQDIEDFLQKVPPGVMVLIDEAYHHFVPATASYASFIDHPVDNDRVIVLRTFSKVYGLAGIRAGYAVASPEVAKTLSARSVPADVNVVGAQAALAALDDQAWVRTCVKHNADARQEFLNQANGRMVRCIDSHANFVMVNAQRPATEVIEHFKKNGIEIGRPFPPLEDYVRVTLGKPAEMLEFWRVWDLNPTHKMEM